MSKRVKVFSIVGLTLAWLFWELWANFDSDPNTWPLTWVIVRYVPAWITLPAVLVLALWLPWHFWSNYQRKRKRPYPYGSPHALSSAQEVGMAQYRKFIVAALGAILTAAQTGAPLTAPEHAWVAAALSVLAALGVVIVPNAPAANAPQSGIHR